LAPKGNAGVTGYVTACQGSLLSGGAPWGLVGPPADHPTGRPSRPAVQEEIFGPVLVATPFDDVEEVAALANGTVYGLSASIWSNDLKRVHRLLPRIKAGTVWVNCHGLLDNALPFGGYKQSGFGREMGRAMIDLYRTIRLMMH
jgi:phenylacetaldehyde dehydrogenase